MKGIDEKRLTRLIRSSLLVVLQTRQTLRVMHILKTFVFISSLFIVFFTKKNRFSRSSRALKFKKLDMRALVTSHWLQAHAQNICNFGPTRRLTNQIDRRRALDVINYEKTGGGDDAPKGSEGLQKTHENG